MSEEKCYSLEKDGTYCLGFPNRYALSEMEIRDVFSDYGDVISVRTSGDERGFRFVRYRSLEEAESAIEGLKGNKKIRILPKKPRMNKNEKSSSKEKQNNGNSKKKVNQANLDNNRDDDCDSNDSFRVNDDSARTHSSNPKKSQPYGGKYNLENISIDGDKENLLKILRLRSMRGNMANKFPVDPFATSDSNREIESQSTVSYKKGDRRNQYQNEKDDDEFNDTFKVDVPSVPHSPHRNKSQHSKKNTKNDRSSVLTVGKKLVNGNVEKESRNRSHSASKILGKSSPLLPESRVTTDLQDDEEPPELVSTEELKQRSICGDEVMKTIMAEEVIIANVPDKFSVLYILCLVEEFEPISITEMKTVSEKGIRYCSVYFKTSKDAYAVEKLLDNFDLSGNKLIVRTPELLINEVAAA